MRVPLAMSWPGVIEPRQTAKPVSLIDVAPTVMGLVGVQPVGLDGTDHSQWVRGHAQIERGPVFSQIRHSGPKSWRAVVSDQWKYSEGPRRPARLFDLDSDPLEQRNLVKADPAQARVLKGLLQQRYRGESG